MVGRDLSERQEGEVRVLARILGMRGAFSLLVSCAFALMIVASGSAHPDTTNSPAIFTAKVTLTDASVAMHPNHAARGSYVSFIITNRGRKKHTFVFGDIKRGPGHTTGFARTLAPNKQLTVVLYLDYRGLLRYVLRTPTGTNIAKGVFRIT
jgi:hypothetical protein